MRKSLWLSLKAQLPSSYYIVQCAKSSFYNIVGASTPLGSAGSFWPQRKV
jgi:hypothetical protein